MKLFSKIFTGYFCAIAFLSAFILYFTFQTINDYYIAEKISQLFKIDYSLKLKLSSLISNAQYAQLDSIAKIVGKELNIRLTVVDTTGVVLADSQTEPIIMENHLDRPEIKDAIAKGSGSSIRYSTTIQEELLYVTVPIELDGKVVAFSRISVLIKEIYQLINKLRYQVFIIAFIFIIVSLFIVLLLSRSLTKPIINLVRISRRVASGDFSARASFDRHDELGMLAESFNAMTLRLKGLFEQSSLQKIETDEIVRSIREGFVVLNSDGSVLMSNEGFSRITGYTFVYQKNYKDIINDELFCSLIENTFKQKCSLSDEIYIDNKFYLCSSNYIKAKEEVAVILYDITRLKVLDDIKKDIVTNVSHELRTPLTAIKGFLETLEEELTNDQQRHYLSIISRHTERLASIVSDLLLLSSLETTSDRSLDIEEIDISVVIKNVLKLFEGRILEKGLIIEFDKVSFLQLIEIDVFKIEQLLINLIDNAIKYTDVGKIQINVYINNYNMFIEIVDTGCGIPKEHSERIFERFYTVDKSRSRKLGGTGLGLSIVKHIVALHSGTILVQPNEPNGTKFVISLPLKQE